MIIRRAGDIRPLEITPCSAYLNRRQLIAAVKRRHITIGMTCFIVLLPLALTSSNLAIRRLGGKVCAAPAPLRLSRARAVTGKLKKMSAAVES